MLLSVSLQTRAGYVFIGNGRRKSVWLLYRRGVKLGLRHSDAAGKVAEPWIVRTETSEARFADLHAALTHAISVLEVPDGNSAEVGALVISESPRKLIGGQARENLETTLTISQSEVEFTWNRILVTYSKPLSWLTNQSPEWAARLVIIELNKDALAGRVGQGVPGRQVLPIPPRQGRSSGLS